MTVNLGRQPVTIVEIDLPICTRVFGTAPCTAALSALVPRKCFNTRATCAAPAAYAETMQTLRFAKNTSGLPKSGTIFPALASVSSRSTEINLSGIDPKSTALGTRARVTVTLQDFSYHDRLTDPYAAQRKSGAAQYSGVGYDPEANGTFFGRMLARHPYYIGKPLRVRRGYVGDDLSAYETAHYVITEISGPDPGGAVQIIAKDVLDLADNTKAVAPAASRGKLAAAIAATATTATLTPDGIGDEYPVSGRVAVGNEVMIFTRSGDVLTLTARGVDGSTAAAHSAGDVVQVCLRYEGQKISDTIYDLLVTHAGVDPAFLPIDDWHAEDDDWLAGIVATATIAKPTGVATLIGELCQFGVVVWWDETAQQIPFGVNRPLAPGETFVPLTDGANLISGSADPSRGDDMRISELHFWHGIINPTASADSDDNYAKLVVATPLVNPYGQDAIKTIYSRWFGHAGDDVAASVIAERLALRYERSPVVLSGAVDPKDRETVRLGALCRVTSRAIQGPSGVPEPVIMQVSKIEPGDGAIAFVAEEYRIDGRFGFLLTDPQADYDTASETDKSEGCFIWDEAATEFPDGTGPYLIF